MANLGGMDTLILSMGSHVYSVQNEDSILNLAQSWGALEEFNVFGDCCCSQANFNNGSTIVVRTAIEGRTTLAPTCVNVGYTGETNNLSFAAKYSTAAGPSAVAPMPAIVTVQSNAYTTSPNPCYWSTLVWSNLVTTHDFDGNRYSDILWRDTSGNVAIW